MYFKKNKLCFLIAFFFLGGFASIAQIRQKVGTNPMNINASAILELESTTKGFLPSRMTHSQMNAISAPSEGLMVYCTNCIPKGLYVYNGIHYGGASNNTTSGGVGSTDVASPTGRIWMDRNLGATQVATSSTDHLAYGSLYQWGRGNDGHQLINWTSSNGGTAVNGITSTLSDTDQPGNSLFILARNEPSDWRSSANGNLWQAASGINNPCPTGYRVPSEAELSNEVEAFPSQDAAGAFASSLKLTTPGSRNRTSGEVNYVGRQGYYWTTTLFGTTARFLLIQSGAPRTYTYQKAAGNSVRCLKD